MSGWLIPALVQICIVLFACTAALAWAIVRQQKRLRSLSEELDHLRKGIDPLTGLLNRSALARWIEGERGFQGVVVVCDMDDFKALNDRYGHLVGDDILHATGKLLLGSIREEDRAFRWGGDEFVVFFRNLDIEVVNARMLELEQHLENFQVRNHGPIAVAFSWGAAVTAERPLRDCLDEADKRMYESKRRRARSELTAETPRPQRTPTEKT